jgi:aspartyl-tRNA(Asn)/glutamyl-tRNA(Gln) amidotransferase subunit A
VAAVKKVMTSYDVIVCASAASPAPKISEVQKFALFNKPPLTFPFNVTGMPALSMCCGYTVSGLPLAVQIAGRAFEEATIYRVAGAYEAATNWRSRRPDLDAGLQALAA